MTHVDKVLDVCPTLGASAHHANATRPPPNAALTSGRMFTRERDYDVCGVALVKRATPDNPPLAQPTLVFHWSLRFVHRSI